MLKKIRLFVILSLLASSLPAIATEPINCMESKIPGFIKGRYIVLVGDTATKGDLLMVLAKVWSSKVLEIDAKTVAAPSLLLLRLRAVNNKNPDPTASVKQPDAQFNAVVQKEIEEIAAINGVAVSCDSHISQGNE